MISFKSPASQENKDKYKIQNLYFAVAVPWGGGTNGLLPPSSFMYCPPPRFSAHFLRCSLGSWTLLLCQNYVTSFVTIML